jgi:paired amphipathic helix protein Sin3a
MVGPGTCKLYYASGCEEAAWRIRLEAGRGERKIGEGAEDEGTEAAEPPKRKNRKKPRSASDQEYDPDEEGEISERERLKERAEARAKERRRWIEQFDQDLVF